MRQFYDRFMKNARTYLYDCYSAYIRFFEPLSKRLIPPRQPPSLLYIIMALRRQSTMATTHPFT